MMVLSAPVSLKTKLITPRLAETRDWYRDLLGLELLEEWDEPRDRGCILGLATGLREALLEIHEGEDPGSFAGISLQFRVPNVDQFPLPSGPRFASSGPEERPWGSRYLFLTDPNGVSVVIFSGSAL